MLTASIFKANDIRGVVTGTSPEWDADGARLLGAAFVSLLGLAGAEFVMGRDMRAGGVELSEAFADGARRAGGNVVDLGLTSTDQLWFASGWLSLPGVQFTASHNPAAYNGIKFCLADARPAAPDFTTQLKDRAATIEVGDELIGSLRTMDTLDAYAAKLTELVPAGTGRDLKVVIDAGNGMAGHTVHTALQDRGLEVIGLYLELDGSFPNHPANPLEPENLLDAKAAVMGHDADLALVFDGDADRCFIIDELGEVVDPSVITAMIALAELAKDPGASIVVNKITSWAVAEAVAGRGDVIVSRVGHTFVKALMAEHDAVFGGEHSAHYYFRDFWFADTGMLAALHVLEQVRSSGRALSELAAAHDGYHRSGELNSTVLDATLCQEAVADAFRGRGVQDWMDGLTVADVEQGWWVNIRASNTEPLLRLNVEARNPDQMRALRDEVLAIIEDNHDRDRARSTA